MGSHPEFRRFAAAARTARYTLPQGLSPVLILTDPTRSGNILNIAAHIPHGWGLIYRHFGAENKDEIAAQLAKILRQRRARFLISADPRLAKRVKADGVHWPEACRHEARKWRGSFSIMTTSSHARKSLYQAAKDGFSAALVSTVFASESPSAGQAMGALRYHRLARATNLPIYGLGGVVADNAGRIAKVGGCATVSGAAVLQKS